MSPAKTAASIDEDLGGPREPPVRWGSRSPRGKGRPIVKFWGDYGHLCKNSKTDPDAVWVVGLDEP